MKHFNQLMITVLSLCLLAPLGACRDEMEGGANTTGKGIQFNYRVEPATPQEESVESRAFSVEASEEEKKIEGDILIAFYTSTATKEGTYVGYKLCPATGVSTDIKGETFFSTDFSTMTGGQAEGQSFDFANTDYDVLVMANYNLPGTLQMTAEQIDTELKKGKNYSEAQALFRMGRPTEGFKTPFFMSAIGTYYHSEKALTVSFRRAVSKFVIENGATEGSFTIQSVQMFNVRDSIYAFDLDGTLASGIGKKGVEVKPEKDSKTVTLYDYETTAEDVSTDKYSALCAIIGITFPSLESTYYYRLNINVMNDRQRIKRNAIYYVKILKVNGVGAPTPEEAIDSDVTLITSSVPSWDEDFDGVFTYASDGIGFALNTTNLQHHVADVSKSNPHKHVQTLWWRNTTGKVLGETEIPKVSKVTLDVKINNQPISGTDALLTAKWVKGPENSEEAQQEASDTDPALYLEIIAYGYFTGGTVTITYTPDGTGSVPAVKTIQNSLTPYNEGPVQLKDDKIKMNVTIDESDYGGNEAFYSGKEMKYTCPTGMRPPSIIEMMWLLGNSRIDKDQNGMYYLDMNTQTQLTLPYTGGTVNSEKLDGAYYWSTGMKWDDSSNTGKDVYIYGTKADYFPKFASVSPNTPSAQYALSLRCVRPLSDSERTEGLINFLYPKFSQLTDTDRQAVEAAVKKLNGIEGDIKLDVTGNDLPIVSTMLMGLLKTLHTSEPGYDTYKVTQYIMLTASANSDAPSVPENSQLATVEQVKQILFQGSVFEKPFYPGNYGDIIVTNDAGDNGNKTIFQQASSAGTSGNDQNVWMTSSMSDDLIRSKNRIYFYISNTKEDIADKVEWPVTANLN